MTKLTAVASSGHLRADGRSRSVKQRRERRNRWIWAIVMWVLGITFLTPFLWMISTSLKPSAQAFLVPMQWFPETFQWENYAEVILGNNSIVPGFLNSLIVVAFRVGGELTTATMAGYGFARIQFRSRDKLFILYLATLLIPPQLLLVPRFIYFQQLGLYDTLWALILPGMFTVTGTFLMRQFFIAQPPEFAEAARIDGASEWGIFWRIYMPLAKPAMSALAILAFVWSWNDYEAPLVMISSAKIYTLPLALTNFVDDTGTLNPGLSMAASVVSIVPILLIFIVMQRKFVVALTRSGIK